MSIWNLLKRVPAPVQRELDNEAAEKRKRDDEHSERIKKLADESNNRFEASLQELDQLLSRGQDERKRANR